MNCQSTVNACQLQNHEVTEAASQVFSQAGLIAFWFSQNIISACGLNWSIKLDNF
ncbi:hypothetical protein [Anabaena sp. PCC 7108]|uniref:hypothetical protein n=1 Tax=Anabaena sp. PCC 7108 TaxID=163908 RepID=UPI000347033D|nr:hypothetical protein [Anabaena sp. PCC 7108]